MNTVLYKTIIITCFIFCLTLTPAYGKDFNWSRWKGPQQNGISAESEWNPKALKKPLKINWETNVGSGYSNVAIKDNYLYTMGYNAYKKQNVIYCLNLKTSKVIWEYSYSSSAGKYEGPKCSPVISEGLVYTLSQDGDFMCHQAKDGTLVWKKQIIKEFKAKNMTWQLSSSVLIEGDLAIINACSSGVALNKKTGDIIWKSDPGMGNYATPVSFKFNNKTYLAIYGNKHLYAVEVKTGKIKWSYPWETTYSIIAADPFIYGNKIFISTGYNNGCALIDISKGKPKTLWRNTNLSTHFSTAVILDDFIYGIDGNAGSNAQLKCLDLKDGSERWSQKIGFANMMSANGYLIILNEKGSLYIVKADPNAYQEISQKDNILKRTCWTAPVLCRSTLYLRNNKGDIVSLDVSK